MLSGMLSDTVVLRSPTTTKLDKDIATWLAGLCKVDIAEYGQQMFAAGSSLEE
jgi:manganese-dependent inorganic pyrophosphatase